jgi:acyl-coenzyme A thioesterase PaaI-like protein
MLNRDLLPENTCFGCGHDNLHGLRIEIVRDPASDDRLRARFLPNDDLVGFPGITHGGAIFTALDCLSTWVATLLGPNREAGWILRSAETVFHKPAPVGKPLTLTGSIQEQFGPWDPMTVHTEARDAAGDLCVACDFKVVPLTPEKLTRIAGLEDMPDNWRTFLSTEG